MTHDNCLLLFRIGLPPVGLGLEELLYENDVDLAVWAHEHSYERSLPVYNRTVMSGLYSFSKLIIYSSKFGNMTDGCTK